MCAALLTLKASGDFQRISRQGKRFSSPAFIMQALQRNDGEPFRLGFTVSRKVGNAVVRNRAKRRLREIVRLSGVAAALKGWEIVLIGKTAAADRDFALMQQEFRQALAALGAVS